MKTRKLISCAMGAAVLASAGLVGCEDDEIYKVGAPADLQDRIDAIAAQNQVVSVGDTTKLVIAALSVGAKDNSDGWNSARSDAFEVPAGKKLILNFTNYSAGASNWNNWNLCVANTNDESKRQDAAENNQNEYLYFLIRADRYGWGGSIENGYNSALLTSDYGNEEVSWEEWLSKMDGANVVMEIDHSSMGPTYVTVTQSTTDGSVFTEQHISEGTLKESIYAWLVCDGSHFEMKSAVLVPSEILAIEDQLPVALEISGAPTMLELGQTNFWGPAYATAIFADGTSVDVDSADLTMVTVPDLATSGKKNVIVSYNKTKQGVYCQAVVAMYELEVVSAVSEISVVAAPNTAKYYFYGEDPIVLDFTGMKVNAVFGDGSVGEVALNALTLPKSIVPKAGAQDVDVVYESSTGMLTTSVRLEFVEGVKRVGATDFSTGWWKEFSDNYTVAPNESKTIKMYVYSDNLEAWHSPCTILRAADMSEYGVVRADNWGWGTGYDGNEALVKENDWDFDVLKANLNGSYFEITIKNNGDGTADVLYDVVLANGEKHFQSYKGIKVNSADLTTALVTEESYLVIVE